ncbi:AAA family ATPase [Rhodospirillales bacterium]|nr:AAA family ATPase [Rhodospirillales bacterium]
MLAITPDSITTFKDIHLRHDGNWSAVLVSQGIDLKVLDGKHHPCPGCGGKDRFRFDDKDGRGTWICSQGGGQPIAGDALELLVHTGQAKDSLDALRLVGTGDVRVTQRHCSATHTMAYEYLHADGSLALTVTRTNNDDGSKKFSQKTGNDLSPSKDPDHQWLPYRLPGWINQDCNILIVEGEKCADAVHALGLAATTNAGGASNWQADLAPHFTGRNVILIPDNDEAGERHIANVADKLRDVAGSIRVLRIPGLAPKGDVADWISAGGTLDALEAMIASAMDFFGSACGMSIDELCSLEIVQREPLHRFFPAGFTLLGGAPKSGKSMLMETVVGEIATTQRVLYLALEYNALMAKERMAELRGCQIHVFLEGQIPRFDEGGREVLELAIKEYKPALLIIDTLSRIKRPGAEKGYEGETLALNEIKLLVDDAGIDCVALHHTRKRSIHDDANDPFERFLGSQALAAVPDNLMVLDIDSDRRVLHLRGRLCKPEQFYFQIDADGLHELNGAGADLRGVADIQATIVDLLKEGPATQKEISDELGLDKGNVSRYCRTLSHKGKIWRVQRGMPWNLFEGDLL